MNEAQPPTPTRSTIAIIGAGLSGTFLALSLHLTQRHKQITIFESRTTSAPELSSGIVLTPNGLTILAKLGVYRHMAALCWQSAYRTYKNDLDETTRRVLVASDRLYGYQNHRLYRRELLRVVKRLCVDVGVEIRYGCRFEGVVGEEGDGVRFSVNGGEVRADVLFGADGIYSSVRRFVAPGVVPVYTGTVGLIAHIRWEDVEWPYEGFERQCTIQGKPGAFFIQPETKGGEEVMVGMQVRHEDLSREEWDRFGRDQDRMVELFARDYDKWHDTGRKVIDAVRRAKRSLYLWPMLKMPKLERWFSEDGKVVLVGDAAHAMPPSSGQGVNQALEDVDTLVSVLGVAGRERGEALRFWQEMRQKRVDMVWNWANNATGVLRMSEEERKKLIAEGKVPDPDVKGSGAEEYFDDMKWLYISRADEEIKDWADGKSSGSVDDT